MGEKGMGEKRQVWFTVALALLFAVAANTIFQLLVAAPLNLQVKDPKQLNLHNADMNMWEEIKDGQHVFTGVFGWSGQSLDLAHDGDI